MEYWTTIFSILAGILAVYYYLFARRPNLFQQHGIPHMKPLLLQTLFRIFIFPKAFAESVKEIYDLHPEAKYVGIFQFEKPLVVIRDVELLKSITIKNFDAFEDHLFLGDDIPDSLWRNNLIALRGDRWRDVRSLLSPAFTSSKMKTMFQLITECAINFSEYLTNVSPENRIMEMKDIFTKYATDVIATCAFGLDVDSMRNPKNDFYVYGKKATNFNLIVVAKMLMHQHLPMLSRLLNLKIIDDRMNAFFTNLIADTIRTRDEKNITRPDMLQLMMDSRGKRESSRELTIEDMTSQAFIFFLGGFESSSALMCFAAHHIAVYPHVQQKLQDEIDKVLEDTNGRPTYEAINEMTYLNAVINEALRMYPPSPTMDRLCVKDFELPATLPDAKPFLVRKGDVMWLPYYGFHRDARYFSEPDMFKPERFLNENKEDWYNPDAYNPFGLGPRMCIGNRFALLETRVLFFHLLARCELKKCDKTSIPLKLKNRGFAMTAKNGFWLNIVPRENQHPTIRKSSASANMRKEM